MLYRIINLVVYLLSLFMAMIGLSCFNFEPFLRKGKIREFYVFYIMASLSLAYLFASFLLNFGAWTSVFR